MKWNPVTALLDIIFPDICPVCGNCLVGQEKCICLSCLYNLPKTNYHLLNSNPVEQRFWGKVDVFRASSFFFYHKGSDFQKILVQIKYKGNKKLAFELGKYAGVALMESEDFNSVDVIVPVPLHPEKRKERGYNQSEWIVRGIASVMGKPVDNESLIRIKDNVSQTSKTVYERYENTFGIFYLLDTGVFENKHVLLVDDVLTTGSTVEACVHALQRTKNIKTSVFTLAVA